MKFDLLDEKIIEVDASISDINKKVFSLKGSVTDVKESVVGLEKDLKKEIAEIKEMLVFIYEKK